ncbi:MAG: hypothetical protein HYZ36_02235 [Pedosphaera parvula]|nr:hypothetical protein [Pedosphaera parvula]
MTEDEYVAAVSDGRRSACETSDDLFRLIEEAVRVYPDSARLWQIRGDMIQLGSEGSPYALSEALVSYQKAISIDPRFARAHESIGYYFDVIEVDLERAEAAFRAAIDCGGEASSYAGLARVLAELGRGRERALEVVAGCPTQDCSIIREIREEIELGQWDPV